MHSYRTIAAASLAAASLLVPAVAHASDVRAGLIGWQQPQMGVSITFAKPMPDANYAVVVQPTNTAGYSTTKDCTYFNVLHLTNTGFEVQHKRCDDGVPVPTDTNITLEWIAVSHQ